MVLRGLGIKIHMTCFVSQFLISRMFLGQTRKEKKPGKMTVIYQKKTLLKHCSARCVSVSQVELQATRAGLVYFFSRLDGHMDYLVPL